MKTPTIYEIKRAVRETAPHFFSRNNMQFFGQRMKDFHVQKTEHPEIFFIWADSWGGNRTQRYFYRDSLYAYYNEALAVAEGGTE